MDRPSDMRIVSKAVKTPTLKDLDRKKRARDRWERRKAWREEGVEVPRRDLQRLLAELMEVRGELENLEAELMEVRGELENLEQRLAGWIGEEPR